MRNYKGNALLIELIIVLLFFALSQTVVVSMFASSHEKAEKSSTLSAALLYSENISEQLSREAQPDTALQEMGFAGEDGLYFYSDAAGFDVQVSITRTEKPMGEMLCITVTALHEGEELLSLPVQNYLPKEVES